jgi:hypothetical protein
MERIARTAQIKKRALRMRTHTRAKNLELCVETHKEGVACGSVSGPPNLKSATAIHREVPTIPLDPPRNGPDVTQIKKIRQHKSKFFCNGSFVGIPRPRMKEALSWKRGPVGPSKDMQELACACKDLW